MLVLFALTFLAWLSGIAVATRLYPESRAERAIAAAVITMAEIVGAVQTLGWLSRLTALSLGLSVLVLASGVLAATFIGQDRRSQDWRGWPRAIAASVWEQVRLPSDALAEAWRARSPTFFVLVATYGLVLWTLWLSWLAPTGAWDGLMYHEPMVGFAIQSHDLAHEIPIPDQMPLMNGYPRMSEYLMLWVCIFSDRRLVDALPSLMMPITMLAMYVIASRFSPWRMGAMALGCALLTIPGAVLELRSTYVDLELLASFMAALAFLTRPTFGARDMWITALALGFLAGTKSSGLAYVAVMSVVALARTIALVAHTRAARPLVHALGALVVLLALAAPQYVRNWELHHNPAWPLRYEIKSLGIVLEGPTDIQHSQIGADQMLVELFGVPVPGQDYHDTRKHAYGYGLTFVAIPLFVLAFFGAVTAWVRAVAFRDAETRRRLSLLWLVVGLGVMTFATSPAFYYARYALPFPAVGLILISWHLGQRRRAAFGDAALAAIVVLNLITLRWAEPAWDVTPKLAWHLAQLPSDERNYADTSHCLWTAQAQRLRDERIGPGDLVAFDSRVLFIGNAWNQHFSNRVEWVPFTRREAYLAALDARHAKWAYVKQVGPEAMALRSVPARWEEIARTGDEAIYQRIGR